MSLLFKRESTLDALADAVRLRRGGDVKHVTRKESWRSSVKWACLRLRADLLSTMPVDCYRRRDDLLVPVASPPVLKSPDGKIDITEWLYSTQWDLDDVGNTFGLITSIDGHGRPAVIELVPAETVTVAVKGTQVTYRYGNETIAAERVWHERQFTTSGSPMGLSPTAYEALSVSGSLSSLEFLADWFSGKAIPAAHLRNTGKTLNDAETDRVKRRFEDTVRTGEVFVTGSEWEYSVLGAKASESAFLDAIKATQPDICRFHGVPGDMVDVESATGNITYANVTQRNLQLLTLNMGPAFTRRERAFSRGLTPNGQEVKFNTDAMLRMDPAARGDSMDKAITSRRMTVTEARLLDNRPPLTPEQEAEFDRLFPSRTQQPAKQGA